MTQFATAHRCLMTTASFVEKLALEHRLSPEIDDFLGALRERRDEAFMAILSLARLAGELAGEITRKQESLPG